MINPRTKGDETEIHILTQQFKCKECNVFFLIMLIDTGL